MIFFKNQKNKSLENLLKQSKQDFEFDQANLKARLLMQIQSRQTDQLPNLPPRSKHSFAGRLALAGTAMLLLAAGTATVALADIAKPGDMLYKLDRFAETAALSLPLPAEQKANLYARMVNERLVELKYFEQQENPAMETEIEAVTQSQQGLTKAIEEVTENKARLEQKGNQKASEKLGKVMIRLEDLAEQHENQAQRLKSKANDDDSKEKIDKNLKAIKKARVKLRSGHSENEIINLEIESVHSPIR